MIGENKIGKTNLVNAFINDGYSESYIRTSVDWHIVDGDFGDKKMGFHIGDVGIQVRNWNRIQC